VTALDELFAFMRAALDEDERVAREAANNDDSLMPWSVHTEDLGHLVRVRYDNGYSVIHSDGNIDQDEAEHIARWDPARVLAEVEAKRRILDWIDRTAISDQVTWSFVAEAPIRLLAQPYAGQPGWREEWLAEQP
jgi:hypothetical protein